MADSKPVFHDERLQRWSVTRRTLEIGGAVLVLLLVVLAVGAIGYLQLPVVTLPVQKPTMHAIKAKAKSVRATLARSGRTFRAPRRANPTAR